MVPERNLFGGQIIDNIYDLGQCEVQSRFVFLREK